jgi:rhodanese-related sulfurtransferase
VRFAGLEARKPHNIRGPRGPAPGSAEGEEELLHLARGHAVGLGRLGLSEAVAHAGGHEAKAGAVERGLGGRQLSDDRPAVGALVEEALDAAHLALGAPEAVAHVVGDVVGELHGCEHIPLRVCSWYPLGYMTAETEAAMPTTTPILPPDLDRLRADHPDLRVVDVRTPGEFAVRHIPGSYNVPLPDLGEHRAELLAAGAGRHSPVVLVCESGRRAGLAEAELVGAGLPGVHVLDGGIAAWERTGRPVNRTATDGAPWPLERQVRLVAGALVATSVAASVVWPPAALLAAAVGTGLVVAAATDSCAMGLALSRLPYNRRRRDACDLPGVVARLTDPEEAKA